MAESAQIKKVGNLHMAILDYMMANPTVAKGNIATEFGVSVSWLSIVTNSDAFKDMLRERQDEFFGAAVVPVREKMLGVVDMALDRITEKVAVMENAEALETADRLLHRLGYAPNTKVNGQEAPGPALAQQNNYFFQAEALNGARQNFGKAAGNQPEPLEGEYELTETPEAPRLERSESGENQDFLPPRRFVPVGPIEWAVPSKEEPAFLHTSTKKHKGNIKKGMDYEAAYAGEMVERFGDHYVPGPWIHYKELGKERTRWCQPDGLLFIPLQSRIILVETKLRHTPDAWWQLKHLYLPVIASMFRPSDWTYGLVEVVKWYDRDTAFPEQIKLCPDVLSVEEGEFGVHIWIPK